MNIKIEQLVYGGSGLGRLEDGQVALIPFTIPGEVATIGEFQEKNGILTGLPEKIVSTSDQRINPPCPYYGKCGGCQYQHISYDLQLAAKARIVSEQLERLGGFNQLLIEKTLDSPNEFGYRNHVQFHLDSEGKPGYQKALSHDVVAVDRCLIVEEVINNLLKTLSFDPEAGLQRVAIRDDGIGIPMLFLSGSSENPPEFEIDFPLNVVYRSPFGDMVLSGEGFNQFEILGKSFQVSAGAFFQTNRDIAAKMVEMINGMVKLDNRSTVLDCYCGVGFFSAFLAEKAGKLIGIESSEEACSDFAVNLDSFDQIELYQGNVEIVLPALDIHPDLAVIDPPRAGIAPAAMKALMSSRPSQIVYVSCDPSTLARDLKIMKSAGYNIESITPVDMFPQTFHIETVTNLHID